MLVYVIFFFILSWITFAKYPSPAMIVIWMFTGFMLVMHFMGSIGETILFISFIFAIVILALTAIVSGSDVFE